jgi:hypothetical protein
MFGIHRRENAAANEPKRYWDELMKNDDQYNSTCIF